MVHEGLRVCEECRRGECSYTKATPGCGRGVGGWKGKNGGRRGGRSSQTYHDTQALGILLICAHIAYSYWSLMAENVLNRAIVGGKTVGQEHRCCFFSFKGEHLGRGEVDF